MADEARLGQSLGERSLARRIGLALAKDVRCSEPVLFDLLLLC